MTTYGYARVSTDGQTLDAQVAALKAADAERVFSEKQSGAKADRAALAKALAVLAAGDVLVRSQHPRPPKRLGDGPGARCGVQVAWRSVGRYHNAAWEVDADGAWGVGRVRTLADHDQDRRRPSEGDGKGREVREEAEADGASDRGSEGEKGGRGGPQRYRMLV
jgi:hypothetical protein